MSNRSRFLGMAGWKSLALAAVASVATACGPSGEPAAQGAAAAAATADCTAPAPAPLQAARAQRLDVSAVAGLAADLRGDVYVAGSFNTAADPDFGNGHTLHAAGNTDVYVARLDRASGLATWAAAFGDEQAQNATAAAVTDSGQVGLVGRFLGTLAFGPQVITRTGTAIDFVAGVNGETGAGLWARSADLGSGGKLSAVAGRSSLLGYRAIVVCGTATIAATDLVSGAVAGGGRDIVVAKLDAVTGAVRWARQIGGAGDQTCNAVAVDLLGNVYLTGQYAGTLDFGGRTQPLPVPGANVASAYVAKLSGIDGRTLAAAGHGLAGRTNPAAITVEGDDVIVAGQISAPVTFGSVTLTPAGGLDAFAARLDGRDLSQVIWAHRWGGTATDDVRGLGVTSAGEVVVAGQLSGTADFAPDAQTLTSAGLSDVYLAKLDGASGKVTFAQAYGDASSQNVTALFVNRIALPSGRDTVEVAGSFAGSIDFGAPTAPLATGGPSDARFYLAELK